MIKLKLCSKLSTQNCRPTYEALVKKLRKISTHHVYKYLLVKQSIYNNWATTTTTATTMQLGCVIGENTLTTWDIKSIYNNCATTTTNYGWVIGEIPWPLETCSFCPKLPIKIEPHNLGDSILLRSLGYLSSIFGVIYLILNQYICTNSCLITLKKAKMYGFE